MKTLPTKKIVKKNEKTKIKKNEKTKIKKNEKTKIKKNEKTKIKKNEKIKIVKKLEKNIKKGAGKSAIKNSLKSVRKNSTTLRNQEAICPICQEDFKYGKTIEVTCCDNKFHYACLCKWLMYNKKCPLCKYTINEDKYQTDCYNYMKYSNKYGNFKNLETFKNNIEKNITKFEDKYGSDVYYLDVNTTYLIDKYKNKNRVEIIDDSQKYIDLNIILRELDYIM